MLALIDNKPVASDSRLRIASMGEYGEIFSWGTHSHGSIHCHKELVGDRLSNIDASESAASVISFGRGLRWLQAPQVCAMDGVHNAIAG